MVRGVEQLNLVISHRRRGPRHGAGTPGTVPYRSRTIDNTRPRRSKARHLKRTARRIAGSQIALALAAATAFVLLVLSGYQAAEGAAIVLGMF
ncbi:hypothetical protein Rhe02_31040 [Rhizocola hellebori]|uniref:Uncharacterized protein n=1 Tax=Rhizocola hellebori TaxID=1392758 RepID=A0A8J3VGD8_9ACTN|nr:hypothetical protein Rhe02_31040 [Rhizocola hellebori]